MRVHFTGAVHTVLAQVMEIKRLNGSIAALKSELNKQQERLEECKR
jgi:hypothetical protein